MIEIKIRNFKAKEFETITAAAIFLSQFEVLDLEEDDTGTGVTLAPKQQPKKTWDVPFANDPIPVAWPKLMPYVKRCAKNFAGAYLAGKEGKLTTDSVYRFMKDSSESKYARRDFRWCLSSIGETADDYVSYNAGTRLWTARATNLKKLFEKMFGADMDAFIKFLSTDQESQK